MPQISPSIADSMGGAYQVDPSGVCRIGDYNAAPPFSSFFPGIAGEEGIPLWAFYVNRGQCLCSMGTLDKQHPILEYMPANRAYQLAATQGFRTFLRLEDQGGLRFHEPFQRRLEDLQGKSAQRMIITADALSLEEENQGLELDFRVDYTPVCQESFAGLVRVLGVVNRAREPRQVELLDGLPLIIPAGVGHDSLLHIRRTIEAFVRVDNLEQGLPFFRGKVEPADRPDVQPIREGHFYAAYVEEGDSLRRLDPVVDPRRVFGPAMDYLLPEPFLAKGLAGMHQGQILENRLPCAFAPLKACLEPGQSLRLVSYVGHAASLEILQSLAPRLEKAEYARELSRRNRNLVEQLAQPGFLCSSHPVLDAYARQNMLDNGLRGGFPITLQGTRHRSTLHLFSRKHGDLERDYNDFQLARSPLAQGNGNYRDVNQNRRCDGWINPEVGDANLLHFLSLIQLDGYNPLVVRETRFAVDDASALRALLPGHCVPAQEEALLSLLEKPFTPGEVALGLRSQRIELKGGLESFMGDVLACCRRLRQTEHGEGYWTDHWTYNLDLVENHLSIHPEEARDLLMDRAAFTWHDSAHVVLPRSRRYLVWEGRPMQLDAVVRDKEKEALLAARAHRPAGVRRGHGQGELLQSTLLVKFLCLVATRMATLDPEGRGVEMEAGKPDWYDALNGLPGLMGSSLNETLELKRHVQFLLQGLEEHGRPGEQIMLYEELWDFLHQLDGLLVQDLSPLDYWEDASTAKEHYRERTRLGVSGQDLSLAVDWLKAFLWACLRRLNQGIARSWDPDSGLFHSYFTHEVVEREELDGTVDPPKGMPRGNPRGLPAFRVTRFRAHELPLFLEGQVHALRCMNNRDEAEALLGKLEQSPLYDSALGMFKVNESLAGEALEIGRARAFAPGWFENESIWLHMEYKLLLELLRCDLPAQFHRHLRRAAIPFLDPARYGRSTLENSSFLVSSAHPDASLHGKGFVARLSGATAEFIHMLLWACMGPRPFRTTAGGELELHLDPRLTGDLFTTEECRRALWLDGQHLELDFPAHSFSFLFLGQVVVSYVNSTRGDSFGTHGVVPLSWQLEEKDGTRLPRQHHAPRGDLARRLRNREFRRLWVELGQSSVAKAIQS